MDDAVVLTREQARAVDAWAVETLGLPSVVLMEHAALNLAGVVDDLVVGELLLTPDAAAVHVVCGGGNNGGDGYAAARHLLGRGYQPTLWRVGPADRPRGDALIQRDALAALGLEAAPLSGPGDLDHADVVIDAVLGSGYDRRQGPPRAQAAHAIAAVNAAGRAGAVVVAADLPSGLDADTGVGDPAAAHPDDDLPVVRAQVTVTFVGPKACFDSSVEPWLGRVLVADIGLPDAAVAAFLARHDAAGEM